MCFINYLWQWPVRSGPSRTVCVALRQCGSVKGAWSWTMASGPQFQGPGGSEVLPLSGPDPVLELSRMLGVRAPGPPNSNDTFVCAFDWEFRGRILGTLSRFPRSEREFCAKSHQNSAILGGRAHGRPRGVSIARSESAAAEKRTFGEHRRDFRAARSRGRGDSLFGFRRKHEDHLSCFLKPHPHP